MENDIKIHGYVDEAKWPATLPEARCSVARPIIGDDLWEIHDLAQRVIQSRQNVGTAMKEQARKVISIIQRLNSNQPPNIRS